MEHPTEIAILDQMLEPVARCLTPEVAEQIAELRADAPTQAGAYGVKPWSARGDARIRADVN